eukprot:TRINITY_DN1066_c0_g2_i1.p1 TRINITY_DN1066_c0_g2~~TRINITY_DN1066_c0_g2_i1.p1  ORF type:complete len:895 (-),score=206.25 TRINITY_DN1066_c0_g2_i1:231-2915(-)
MVHQAFVVHEVQFEKVPKVECMVVFAGQLLVGTSEGSLIRYDIIEENLPEVQGVKEAVVKAQVRDVEKNFAKKAVARVEVIPEIDRILSLSDGQLFLHDLFDLSFKGSVASKFKGISQFAVHVESADNIALCIAAKKRVLVCMYDMKTGVFMVTKDFPVPDTPKLLMWCGQERVCVGFKKEYLSLDVRAGEFSEIFVTGKSQTPHITQLEEGELLLARDTVGFAVDYFGKPTRKYGVSWIDVPNAVHYISPYVISFLPQFADVRTLTPKSESLVQTIQLIKGGSKVSGYAKSVSFDDSIVSPTTIDRDILYVWNGSSVFRLRQVNLVEQIHQMLHKSNFEEAIQLCLLLPDSPELLEMGRTMYGIHMFQQKNFSEGLHQFTESSVNTRSVLSLYPSLKFLADMSPEDLSPLIASPGKEVVLTKEEEDDAMSQLIPFLTGHRLPLHKGLASRSSLTEVNDAGVPALPSGGAGGGVVEGSMDFDGVGSIEEEISEERLRIGEIVDTALLLAYMRTKRKLVSTFLKIPNRCNIDIAEENLKKEGMLVELVDFYQSKEMHREALQLLFESSSSWSKSPELVGIRRTVEYIKQLDNSHVDLALEYCKWVLEENLVDAKMALLTPGVPSATFDPISVKKFLQQYFPSIVIEYLEFCVNEREPAGCKTPEIHNDLVLAYLKIPSMRRKLQVFLIESKFYDAQKLLRHFPYDSNYEERALLLSRMGAEEQVLEIYAHRLKRFDLVVECCRSSKNGSVFLTALHVFMNPPEADMPVRVDFAVDLLSLFPERVSFVKALSLIPPHIPMTELLPYFDSLLKAYQEERRGLQVQLNLRRSENQQVRERLIEEQSRTVTITSQRICPRCDKRIGKSAFGVYPNGEVVHFVCLKEEEKEERAREIRGR